MSRPKSGPLYEESTSYRKTGVPCGNPQRYESRGVMRMTADRKHPFRDQRMEAPLEDIETEGDRQLKQLLDKQLKKTISLDEHLSKKKDFTKPAVQKPISEETSGTLSLEKYQDLEARVDHVNELRQLGLTEEETELKLVSEGLDIDGKPITKKRKYGEDPSVYQAKLEAINAKISAKHKYLEQSTQFAGAKYMSRHEMDLEKAISHDRQKAKSLSILMTDVRPDVGLGNDPMDNIKELLVKVESGRSKKFKGADASSSDSNDDIDSDNEICRPSCLTFEEFMKESKDELSKCKVVDIPQSECPDCARSTSECYYHSRRKKADEYDNIDSNVQIEKETKNRPNKKKKHKKKQKRPLEIGSKQTTEAILDTHVEPIPVEVIEKYRLTVEEIKQIDRFMNYSPGEPNKTIYIKNLSVKVTDADLRTMFMRYEKQGESTIEYRLLTGRMKGQAFVSFPDIETASRALETVNGYNFKGKPVIIQFGKNKSQEIAVENNIS